MCRPKTLERKLITNILKARILFKAITTASGLLPVVFMAPSWLAPTPSVVLHSSSSLPSSSLWPSPASWHGSRDWLRPLSLSLQSSPDELLPTGEPLHRDEGHRAGLTDTLFSGVLRVAFGGPPFLPKDVWPLTAVVPGLFGTTGPTVALSQTTAGWGLQWGAALGLQGEVGVGLGSGFFPVDGPTGTGGGGDTGAAWEGLGKEWCRSWATPGASLCGEAGGVWKLSPWDPKEREADFHIEHCSL